MEQNLRVFIILKCFIFAIYGTFSILLTFLPVYLNESGFDRVAVGMIMAGGPFISLIANPFWGYWSDRTQNLRRILLIILISNLIIIPVVFQFNQFMLIYIGMLVFFFFQTPLFSLSNSLILNSIEHTNRKFGEFRWWGSLGWALMAVGAGPVLTLLGMPRLWVIYVVMMLISIIFAIRLPRAKGSVAVGVTKPRLKDVFSSRIFVIFLILGILVATPNAINSMFISIFVSELGGSEVMIGWTVFFSAAFEIPIFILMDRYMKRNVQSMILILVFVCLLFSARWLLMSLVQSPWQVLLIQMLHCVTFGIYFYVGTQLTMYFVPDRFRASGQAVYALAWNGVAGILAGFVGGWMFEALGAQSSYQIGVYVSMISAVGFGAIWFYYKKGFLKPQPQSQQHEA